MKTDFFETLNWRGMVHQFTPDADSEINKGMQTGYIGFDPTADSLHLGHLATIMVLKQFQLAGHKPIALVGGATGMIGDPSGKSKERNLLDENTIRANEEAIKKQLSMFLEFGDAPNSAEVVNNYDWFGGMGFLQFLRDVGKHLTVNYMVAKDSVKSRLETGISFTEFSYQLLQAYDFYYLWKHKNCNYQMGGSDQWGNITSGTELIRRMGNGSAFAITTPLITRADGSKFGKSATGENVWLDARRTSPYKFYQFLLNVKDDDTEKLLKVLTLKSQTEIEELLNNPNPNVAKKALAETLTETIHGRNELNQAQMASEILFGKVKGADIEHVGADTLKEVFESIPSSQISKVDFENCTDLIDLVAELPGDAIFKSKSEARKLIKGGGVSINKDKIQADTPINSIILLQNKFILVQKGKKNYHLIEVE